MAASGLKYNLGLAIISKCRTTILVFSRPSLSRRQSITKCTNLTSLQSRTFSSCKPSNTYRPIRETPFLSSNKSRSVFIGIKPLHNNPILYQCNQPYLSLFITQSKFSPSYSTEKEDPDKKLSLFQQFKQMYRDYWYVLVPVHAVTSLAWFGGFYYLLKSGVDVVAVLESYQISEKIISPLRDSSAGYLAVSYAMYKILTPIRYAVTLGGTTLSINYLKKWGYIRPIPSREKLQEMYLEKRDNLKERRASIISSVRGTKEGIRERKENIIKTVQVKTEELKVQSDILKKKAVKGSQEERK